MVKGCSCVIRHGKCAKRKVVKHKAAKSHKKTTVKLTSAAREACKHRPREYRKNCQKEFMRETKKKPRALKGQTKLTQYD